MLEISSYSGHFDEINSWVPNRILFHPERKINLREESSFDENDGNNNGELLLQGDQMKKILISLLAIAMIINIPALLNGQASVTSNPVQKQQNAARYILPGESTDIRMEVNLWGEVARPGTYVIPSDMGIIGLISSASGPSEYAKLKHVRVIRGYPEDSENPYIIEVDVKQYMETGKTSNLPSLKPGDTVYVPGNMRKNLSSSLSVAATVSGILAGVALMFERLQRASSY